MCEQSVSYAPARMRAMAKPRLGLTVLALTIGVSALPACSKLKQRLSGADGGAASAQAAGGDVPSLDGFEGEMTLLIKPGPKEHPSKPIPPINLQVKGGKLRLDAPADMEELKAIGHVYLLLAAKDKKLSVVLDDFKEVVSVDLDKLGEE